MGSTHSSLHYHLVFSTRKRESWFEADFRPPLFAYLGGVVRGLKGVPHAVGGVADHVHLLVGLRPAHCLSDFMRDLKADSSKWIKGKLQRKAFGWQSGYGAFSVGAPDLEKVRQYVLSQEEHHRKLSFEDEYLAFLRRGLVEYDERYLWG
ncbi:IS200/IS605 family transposase [Roseibacillus ishigakijimensis]|uniref:IS200/IS605 family transposase n=1 Tax=Roseibacillus ishigakijimensis TaxID=454146 RepID=A0A934RUT6_9BACT|nr:IS200/IS605 family transposase [Roseibacillus ishigakijimensis]MBK1834876.1 IS200/IS605 family transposase [Roseibacillus ishigakijimensis]